MITKLNKEFNLISFEKKANQAFSEQGVVARNTSTGLLEPATASTAIADIAGVLPYAIDSAHPQYAGQELIEIDVPDRDEEYLADVGAGSTSGLKAGDFIDLQDAVSVNVGASAVKVFKVVRVVSTTQVIVTFNV